MRVIDLTDGDDARVAVPGNVKIGRPALSQGFPAGQLAFVTRANVGLGADEAYSKGYDGRLYRYDIAGERLQPVDTLSEAGNVESASYSRDGGALLYRTLDGAYYLTGASLGNADQTIPLGKYDGSGGFDRTSARISFQTRGGAAIYDARTRRVRELPGIGVDRGSSTPAFMNNSDDLAYRRSVPDPDTGETTSRVSIVNAAGEEDDHVDSPPGAYFFDNPVFSPDDHYALVETAPESARIDGYLANPQPVDARVTLYDLSGRQPVDEVRGVDPVWNG